MANTLFTNGSIARYIDGRKVRLDSAVSALRTFDDIENQETMTKISEAATIEGLAINRNSVDLNVLEDYDGNPFARLRIPYTGDAYLWQQSTEAMTPPLRGVIYDGVRVARSQTLAEFEKTFTDMPSNDEVRDWATGIADAVQAHIDAQAMLIAPHNAGIPDLLAAAVARRRAELNAFADLNNGLGTSI